MKKLDTLRLAYISLAFNGLYSFYNLILGIFTKSWWFTALFGYYSVLSVVRFGVILSTKKEKKENISQSFIMKFTGAMFVIMGVTLAGTTYLSFKSDTGIKYSQIIMISIALYTTIKVTLAIVNLVKERNNRNLNIMTLKGIALADALVSVFSLQRSMLTSFEGMTPEEIKLFNAITGTVVYILIFVLGVFLIGGSRYIMAKSKLSKANEKVAGTVTKGYKKIEEGVVGTYTKIEDKFVDMFLTHEGESIEDAKKRLKEEEKNKNK